MSIAHIDMRNFRLKHLSTGDEYFVVGYASDRILAIQHSNPDNPMLFINDNDLREFCAFPPLGSEQPRDDESTDSV